MFAIHININIIIAQAAALSADSNAFIFQSRRLNAETAPIAAVGGGS